MNSNCIVLNSCKLNSGICIKPRCMCATLRNIMKVGFLLARNVVLAIKLFLYYYSDIFMQMYKLSLSYNFSTTEI